jgi:hypothetical protein
MWNRGSVRSFSESHRAKAMRPDRTIFLPRTSPIPPPPSRHSHQPGHAAESSRRFPPQESEVPPQGSRQPRQRSQPPEQRSGRSRQESGNLPQGSGKPGQRSRKLRHGSGDLRLGSELPIQGSGPRKQRSCPEIRQNLHQTTPKRLFSLEFHGFSRIAN